MLCYKINNGNHERQLHHGRPPPPTNFPPNHFVNDDLSRHPNYLATVKQKERVNAAIQQRINETRMAMSVEEPSDLKETPGKLRSAKPIMATSDTPQGLGVANTLTGKLNTLGDALTDKLKKAKSLEDERDNRMKKKEQLVRLADERLIDKSENLQKQIEEFNQRYTFLFVSAHCTQRITQKIIELKNAVKITPPEGMKGKMSIDKMLQQKLIVCLAAAPLTQMTAINLENILIK